MFVRRSLRSLALAAVATLIASPLVASAGATTGTLTISASIAQTCTVANQTLAFGAYDPTVGALVNATPLALSVTCTKGATNVYLDLDNGQNNGVPCPGSFQRCMKGTGGSPDYLNYQLYSDTNHTIIWGAGTPAGSNTGVAFGPFTSSTIAVTNDVYGQIPASQDAKVDSYSDSVVETVNF